MRKSRVLILIISFLLLVPFTANAQTIQGYRNKIKALEQEKAESESKSEDVQKKIDVGCSLRVARNQRH